MIRTFRTLEPWHPGTLAPWNPGEPWNRPRQRLWRPIREVAMNPFQGVDVRTVRSARALVVATLMACGTLGTAIQYAQGRDGYVPAPPRDAAAAPPVAPGTARLAGVVV